RSALPLAPALAYVYPLRPSYSLGIRLKTSSSRNAPSERDRQRIPQPGMVRLLTGARPIKRFSSDNADKTMQCVHQSLPILIRARSADTCRLSHDAAATTTSA